MKNQHSSRTPLEIDFEALRQKSVSELLEEQEAIWKEKRSAAADWIVAYETVLKEKGYTVPNWDAGEQLKQIKARAPELFPSRCETVKEVPQQKKTPRASRILRSLPAIVAALCALLIVANAAGAGQWFIEFKDGAYVFFNASGQIETEVSDMSQYRSLQDALDQNGITGYISPTWIPERFTLESVNAMNMDDSLLISAHCMSDNKGALNIFVSTDSSTHVAEGNEDSMKKYESHGTEFQIAVNYNQTSVSWKSGSSYCQITGDLTMPEVKAMINSIF